MSTSKRGQQLKLLPLETGSLPRKYPPVSTISFFNGDGEGAQVWIRRRLAEVLEANPWLDGRLEKARGGETVLQCRKVIPAEGDALPAMLFRMERPGEGGASISRAMPFEHIEPALASAGLLVKVGDASVGQDEPLFKVSLLLDAEQPKDKFAMVVSMSHLIGDGYTYYAVHNMLGKNGVVIALNPTRNLDAPLAIDSAIGCACRMSEPPLGFWLNLLPGIMRSKLFGAKAKTAVYLVDEAWVARQKRAAAAEGDTPKRPTSTACACWSLSAGPPPRPIASLPLTPPLRLGEIRVDQRPRDIHLSTRHARRPDLHDCQLPGADSGGGGGRCGELL